MIRSVLSHHISTTIPDFQHSCYTPTHVPYGSGTLSLEREAKSECSKPPWITHTSPIQPFIPPQPASHLRSIGTGPNVHRLFAELANACFVGGAFRRFAGRWGGTPHGPTHPDAKRPIHRRPGDRAIQSPTELSHRLT